MGTLTTNTQCPRCAASGRDTSGNNLVNFGNGTQHCFSCGHHIGNDVSHTDKVSTASLYLPPSAHVKVSCETAAFFAVTSDGTVTYRHYFNSVNELVGVKTRNYSAESNGAHKHETIRYYGTLTLYGLHTLQHTDTVVLVEGESDTEYVWQCFDGTVDVLGIPGADTAKVVNDYVVLLSTYSRIVVVTDNDAAGGKLRNDVYSLLPEWLIYEARYPKHANDACDCTASEIIACVNDAVLHSLDTRIISGSAAHKDAQQRAVQNTRLLLPFPPSLNGLNRLLRGGIHGGDCIGLIGNSGKGKSTLAYQVAAHAVNTGVPVLFVTNEDSADYVSLTLATQCSGEAMGNLCTIVETTSFEALIALLNRYATHIVIIDVVNSVAPDFLDAIPTAGYMRRLVRFVNYSGVGTLFSVHTTSNNEQFKPLPLKLSDAAGGRAVQRALTGAISFTADVENTPPNSRLLTLAKPMRHRRVVDTTPVLLNYDPLTNTYTEYNGSQTPSSNTSDLHATSPQPKYTFT